MVKPLTIAVDGPASAGKGTVARAVARSLSYDYVDTGAMYRSVALFAQRRGVPWTDEQALAALALGLVFNFRWDGDVLRINVDGEDVTGPIRRDEMGQGASEVSRLPAVRRALFDLQRGLGARGGVVMDGRDIGTVVLPEAELKVFLTADPVERARRRHDELIRRGEVVSFDEVYKTLNARDRQDKEREVAPLKQAPDAVLVDTSTLTAPEVVAAVLKLARDRGARD